MELIGVSSTFGGRPSSYIVGLSSYEAYCLDVACATYVHYLRKDRVPLREEEDATQWL